MSVKSTGNVIFGCLTLGVDAVEFHFLRIFKALPGIHRASYDMSFRFLHFLTLYLHHIMQSCKLQMKNEVNLSIPPSTPFRRRRVKSRPSNIVFCFLNIQFFFLLNHSLCSSGKDFEVSSSSNASVLVGVFVFCGICIGFS